MRISDWSSDVCSSDLPDAVRGPQRQLFPPVDLQAVSGAVGVGVARRPAGRKPARITERPRFETPILLVGKGTAAQFRAPEVKTRAATRPRVPPQGVIHQFVAAPAARPTRYAAPIGHHRAAPVKAEHTRHRPAAISSEEHKSELKSL